MQKYEKCIFYFVFSEQTYNKFKIWEYFNQQLFLITIDKELFVTSWLDITDLYNKINKK